MSFDVRDRSLRPKATKYQPHLMQFQFREKFRKFARFLEVKREKIYTARLMKLKLLRRPADDAANKILDELKYLSFLLPTNSRPLAVVPFPHQCAALFLPPKVQIFFLPARRRLFPKIRRQMFPFFRRFRVRNFVRRKSRKMKLFQKWKLLCLIQRRWNLLT